jgi:hypothetical protein
MRSHGLPRFARNDEDESWRAQRRNPSIVEVRSHGLPRCAFHEHMVFYPADHDKTPPVMASEARPSMTSNSGPWTAALGSQRRHFWPVVQGPCAVSGRIRKSRNEGLRLRASPAQQRAIPRNSCFSGINPTMLGYSKAP